MNRLNNKLGSKAFWLTILDNELDKAARILNSFCKDRFYVGEEKPTEDGTKEEARKDDWMPKGKQRVIKRILTDVIRRAKGLAIITTMRTGLWASGAGGSGVLVARKEDGLWSPPSGIMLHIDGLGFLVGVDIYDCVVVINTEKALEAFTNIRCTLGGEVSAVADPVGMGGVLETEVHKRQLRFGIISKFVVLCWCAD
jgi:lipid-binding SYLF domain-containing protein